VRPLLIIVPFLRAVHAIPGGTLNLRAAPSKDSPIVGHAKTSQATVIFGHRENRVVVGDVAPRAWFYLGAVSAKRCPPARQPSLRLRTSAAVECAVTTGAP
jgi:hypothetical protein